MQRSILLSIFLLTVAFVLVPSWVVFWAGEAQSASKNDLQWVADPEDRRIALVIGNADYYGDHEDLDNPINDARAISDKLRRMGYTVDFVADGDHQSIRASMKSFVDDAKGAKVALFFYAGHGVQILSPDGSALRNQLLPTDYAAPSGSPDSGPEPKMIDLADFLSKLEGSGVATRILLMDACRNIPSRFSGADSEADHEVFEIDSLDRRAAAKNLLRNTKMRSVKLRNGGTTVASAGFGEMNYELGTLVVYSTGTGRVAPDGIESSANSPFTTALLKHIDDPDRKVEDVLKNVKAEVVDLTSRTQFQQTPLVFNALDKDIFLVGRLPRKEFYTRMQTYLKRSGCYTGSIDGKWGPQSTSGLDRFKAMSSLPLATTDVNMGTLNAIRQYLATATVEFCQPPVATVVPRTVSSGRGSPSSSGGSSGGSASAPAARPKAPVGNPYSVGAGGGVPF